MVKIVLNFGKYKDENITLGELLKKDKGYMQWLVGSDIAKQSLKDACAILLDMPNEEEQEEKLKLLTEFEELTLGNDKGREAILKHYKVESDSQMTIQQLKEAIAKIKEKVGK